ncbi:MAG: class II fructose-bisphosphate aldolase [Verrucomicrobia bacterium]|nr:class II fructose-bisphosphate aldolase [Verrucomicrobiota bacterium]
MLVTLNEVLPKARANHYAVPAFDIVEDVMVRAVLETAAARRSPVILMGLAGAGLDGAGWRYIPTLVRALASQYNIPIVFQLDHATELDQIKRGLDAGFSSVMLDGSRLPFAQNVEITRKTVELAHPLGITVEGELGYVGGMNLEASGGAESVLTEPGEVAKFCDETGVDALAVSIGNAHGKFASLPHLHMERLKELNVATKVPLVLHGGSGTPDSEVREAVKHGIAKLNIFADCRIAMMESLKNAMATIRRTDPLPEEFFGPLRDAVASVTDAKIGLLSAANRV